MIGTLTVARRILRGLLLVVLLVGLAPTPAHAQWWRWFYPPGKPTPPPTTTIYVRSGAGGANTGLNWTNAYTALPAALLRGATYYVADGDYPSRAFDTADAGTTTITIRKATVSEHGTNAGWLDTYGDGTAAWQPLIFNTSHWIFDGATGGGPGSWKSGHGFTFNNVACTQATFIESLDGVSGLTVRHVSFTQTGDTEVCTSGTSAFRATDGVGTVSDSLFEYLYFDNLGSLPFVWRYGSGNTIQYTYSGNICGVSEADITVHCEWMVLWGMDDLTIRWNYIGESPSSGGVVMNSDTSERVKIYGNVFRNGVPIQCNATCLDWRMFNNTFATGITSGPLAGGGTCTGCLFYNNLIYGTSFAARESELSTHDYNWYSLATGWSCMMDPSTHENIVENFPMGCDAIPTTSNPFVNVAGTTPEDLRLMAPLAGQPGTDVCALDDCTGDDRFNVDAFGVVRGADGVWDRGAYED